MMTTRRYTLLLVLQMETWTNTTLTMARRVQAKRRPSAKVPSPRSCWAPEQTPKPRTTNRKRLSVSLWRMMSHIDFGGFWLTYLTPISPPKAPPMTLIQRRGK
ncbi:hypothetical protein DER45DRAFT_552225 [Fusarium avenaceum]|nr:hypothetical protein DER45DRAFT_552225 [Fusarium avenaceum]